MSEERLKRIEILLETCAKTTVANQADIKSLIEQTAENKAEIKSLIEQTAENKAEIKEVRQQVNQLTVQMASLSEMFIETIGVMKTMQSDIKGLQTENNRILDNLFGNNQN